MYALFATQLLRLVGKFFDPINRFDHISWVDAIPTTEPS